MGASRRAQAKYVNDTPKKIPDFKKIVEIISKTRYNKHMKHYVIILAAVIMFVLVMLTIALAAAQPPTTTATYEPLKPSVEKALRKCKACHGKSFEGRKTRSGKIKAPAIAGTGFRVIYTSLTNNVPKQMKPIVKGLTERDIWEISHYISNLPANAN